LGRLGVAVAVLVAGSALAADQSLRVFKMHFRPANEATALVEPLLSTEGSVLLQPGLNAITVRDTPEVLARVAEALAKWDVTPPVYKVRVRVFLASRESRPAEGPTPAIPELGERLHQLFPFTNYQEVATVQVTATDGSTVEAAAGERYHLRFVVRSVPQDSERVQLAQLELTRRERGKDNAEVLRPLVRSTVTLLMKQHSVLGSASAEDAHKALFLVLLAERAEKP
jgi:hypothetical protein